jgi:DNA segregation ATPase FtsK/SpoIIIE, S-DNA-T family
MYSTMNTRGGSARHTRRATGGEWRGLAWLCRHPGFLLVPAAITAAVVWFGPWPVLWTVVGTTVDLIVWARVHPPTFDRWAAPWLRRYWRRWTVYRARRWTAVLVDCDLVRDNRRTGQLMVPRVLCVRSRTRSIDTLYVRMARGQDLHVWTERPTHSRPRCSPTAWRSPRSARPCSPSWSSGKCRSGTSSRPPTFRATRARST